MQSPQRDLTPLTLTLTLGHMLRFSKRSVPEDQMEEQTDDQSRFHGPSLDR